MPAVQTNPNGSTRDTVALIEPNGLAGHFFDGAVAGARSLGFEYLGYMIGVPAADNGWRFVAIGNQPRTWQERYVRRGHHAIDPLIAHARSTELPLTWSREIFGGEALVALARDTLAIDLNHGWTLPMHSLDGGFGMLTLARRAPLGAEELRAKQPMMQWLAQVVHQRLFGEFRSRQRNAARTLLTERELNCLRLAAEGATAFDMARLTGVGERTVNFHVANAIAKLGAANKTHAVALALRMGLLD